MTGPPSDRIPDGITPLVGYRAWQVVEEAAGLVFYPLASIAGVGRRPAWIGCRAVPARRRGAPERVSASTPDGSTASRTRPRESCSCRFYAMKELHPHLVQLVAFARRRPS